MSESRGGENQTRTDRIICSYHSASDPVSIRYYFALISAFEKGDGYILKNPIALPTSFLYTEYVLHSPILRTAILGSVFLTVVWEDIDRMYQYLSQHGIERRKSKTTSLIYTYFLAGMIIPFHLYMFLCSREGFSYLR